MAIDIDDELALYMPFNAGSGISARDDSGHGNSGTLHNMSDSNWVPGKSNTALEFNGTDEYVSCADAAELRLNGAFSISFWCKQITFVHTWPGILRKGDYSTDNGYALWSDSAGQVTYRRGAPTLTTSAGALTTEWRHFVFVYEVGAWYWYVDGALDTDGSHSFATNAGTADLWMGRGPQYGNNAIDELRFYNRALSAADVQWLYDHPSGTQANIPSGRACFTDLSGTVHTMADMISLEVSLVLTDATDSFSMTLLNTADRYSWLERGCAVEILTGMSGVNTKKLGGFVTEVVRSIEDGTNPIVEVAGEDGSIRLNHIYFSGRYYDKEVSALVKAILDATDFTTGSTYRTLADIDASNAYIEATAYTIEEASYVWTSLGAAIKELAGIVGFGWYVDVDSKLHFFDPTAATIADTILDVDLEGSPSITDVGDIVNRAVVVGGYQQIEDQSGGTQTTTTTITASTPKNQSFVPTEDYLSSVLVHTELVSGSESDITISIQGDSASAPDGVNLSNGQATIKLDSIVDDGYTEFRFSRPVTLTPSDTYWIVLKGTTSDGVKVGVNGSAILDYITRYPTRVAVMTNDNDSQDTYGLYMQVFKDKKLEDSQLAEIKANEMLMPDQKKAVSLTVRGDALKAGDIVQLTITESGIAIDKTMKILSSTQTLDEIFIYNDLEMEET